MVKKKVSPIRSYMLKNNKGKRYEFPVYIGIDPLTGKPKHSTRRGFKTIKEAELELARLKLAVANGTYHQKRVEIPGNIWPMGKTI